MTTAAQMDRARMEAFVGKVLGDASGAMTTTLAAIGDSLGLFKDLAEKGAATSHELAKRASINERYSREWLGAMAAAGYLEYEPADQRFSMPPEHVAVLAQEGSPVFFGGVFQMFPVSVGVLDQLKKAFKEGGGVPLSAYGPAWWEGMERFTAGRFENQLLQEWVPGMPDVQAKLEQGADVADVGCGSGRAIFKMVGAYPKSRYTGYDISDAQLARANANAKSLGVTDRVSFRQADVAGGLQEKYDVVTTFDVIHDAVDPAGLLRGIRQALKPDGIYVCLDVNCSEKLEENVGPLGAMFHGFSVLYCMTTSLANGGTGLGTLGFHEGKVREMCAEAGFGEVRRLPLENPFNNVYEIRA